MKIEFKKVPQTTKDLVVESNSVKIEGTFCKISHKLIKIDAVLKGTTDINCSRCGDLQSIEVDEKLDFLLSDGIYKNNEENELVIEIQDGLIDFDEIVESELNSIKSDYYICEKCLQDSNEFEKEF